MFSSTLAEFLHTGERDGHVMPAKIVQLCQSRRENGHVTEIASLMEGEWSCYGGGQFNGERMVMLQRWSLFNEGRMVMLQKSSV